MDDFAAALWFVFVLVQLYEGKNIDGPSDTCSGYRQTELTERSKERLVVERCKVINKSITELEGGPRGSGQTPAPSTTPSGTPPQTTEDDMTGRWLGQQQVQEESLVAVLIIEDSDKKEQWMNSGALVYDLRTPNTRPKSGPPLIGTKFTIFFN